MNGRHMSAGLSAMAIVSAAWALADPGRLAASSSPVPAIAIDPQFLAEDLSLPADRNRSTLRSTAHAINDAGQVLGSVQRDSGWPAIQFFDGSATQEYGAEGWFLRPRDLNNAGVILANAEVYNGDRWVNRGIVIRDGAMTMLPFGEGGHDVEDISNTGIIVGNIYRPDDSTPQAYVLHGAQFQWLGRLGGRWSRAIALNDAGQIVGAADDAGGAVQAFVWSDGRMQPLGTLGGAWSVAYGINGAGEIVGQSETGTGVVHGFIYAGGMMRDLGLLNGEPMIPIAIADTGTLIGVLGSGPGQRSGVVRTREGTVTVLGTAYPMAINDRGDVVGVRLAAGTPTPFLLPGAGLYDLRAVTSVPPGLLLNRAADVNNAGQIAGDLRQVSDGSNGIHTRLTRLVPTP